MDILTGGYLHASMDLIYCPVRSCSKMRVIGEYRVNEGYRYLASWEYIYENLVQHPSNNISISIAELLPSIKNRQYKYSNTLDSYLKVL